MTPTIYLVKVYQIINSENKATIKELNIQEFYSAYPYVFLNTKWKAAAAENGEISVFFVLSSLKTIRTIKS